MLKSAMANFHVIIPAAGSGSRMGSETPKQYLALLGKPLIQHTLDIFTKSARISSVNIVLSPDDILWDKRVAVTSSGRIHILRCGGDTRAATVLNGLRAIQNYSAPDDWVLVHDAARPCLSSALLDHLLDTLQNDSVGGLLAIPLADTLKRSDIEQRVMHTEPREGLWQAQTPQMFRYEMLKRALQATDGKPTDEAQAIETLGLKPKLVPGELSNLKVTFPQDLLLAEAILKGGR